MEDSPTETEPSIVLTPDANDATHFDPDDVYGSTPINYSRLLLLNRGTWKSRWEENKEVTHRRDNMYILSAIASQLELTDYQKEEARNVFDEIELGEIGKPVRLVAFGVCAVVANEDVHDGCRYHPQMNDPCELFVHIADRLDFTTSQLHSIIGTVNHLR